MEYGNIEYMAAAPTYLHTLDRVQAAAERIGNFTMEPLQDRRDASLIGLNFKILDGDVRGGLNDFTPDVVDLEPARVGRYSKTGLHLVSKTTSRSLNSYERSILGRAPKVWGKLPQHLLQIGLEEGWQSITKRCQRLVVGKDDK